MRDWFVFVSCEILTFCCSTVWLVFVFCRCCGRLQLSTRAGRRRPRPKVPQTQSQVLSLCLFSATFSTFFLVKSFKSWQKSHFCFLYQTSPAVAPDPSRFPFKPLSLRLKWTLLKAQKCSSSWCLTLAKAVLSALWTSFSCCIKVLRKWWWSSLFHVLFSSSCQSCYWGESRDQESWNERGNPS